MFDLVDNVPKPETADVATNTKVTNQFVANKNLCVSANVSPNRKSKCNIRSAGINVQYNGMVVTHNVPNTKNRLNKKTFLTNNALDSAKIDVYYFDHGNAA